MKKKLSNIVSLILITVMLVNTFSPIFVLAAEVSQENKEAVLEPVEPNIAENKETPNETEEKNEGQTTEENKEEEKESSEEKQQEELPQENSKEEIKEEEKESDEVTTNENNVTETSENESKPQTEASESKEKETKKKSKISLTNTKENLPMDENAGKGNIEIENHFVLPIRNVEKNNIIFKIYDSEKNSAKIDLNKVNEVEDGFYTGSIKLGNQTIRFSASERDKDGKLLSGIDYSEKVVYLSINLYSLEKGTYIVELSGTNFVTYKKNITLKDYSQRLMISDEKGLFEIGDVNSDGIVNDDDIQQIKNNLGTENYKYDLNLDRIVDIADVNYATAMVKGTKKEAKVSNTSSIMQSENVSFEISKETLVEDSASLSSLFQDEGVVKLKKVDDEPIELGIDLSGEKSKETVEMSEIRITVGENAPQKMTLLVETEDGNTIEKTITVNIDSDIDAFTDEVTKGTLKIDLGKQVAVKKVTIRITETSSNNLAEIAKVEFLNNVKVNTKEPDDFYTPKGIKIDDSVSEQLTISFDSVPNVTGYEIEVIGPEMNTVFQTTFTSFTVEDLKNYATYKIRVQSVNQEWRSGWSEEVTAVPQSTRKPPAPNMVEATPTFSGIDFNWKDMDDTLTYNIYYRKVGTDEYKVVREISGTKYTLKGLEAAVEYEAYITGNNKLGEGDASATVKAKTLKAEATIVPQYKLINTSVDGAEKNNHIKDVIYSSGTMTDNNKYSIVDDNHMTYWETTTWHAGTHYSVDNQVPIVVLDKTYKMDEFILTVPDAYQYSFKTTVVNPGDVLLKYWNDETEKFENSTRVKVEDVTLRTQKDENGRTYYLMKLAEPIEANAVQFGVTSVSNAPLIQISEAKIYEYDSLVDDVAKLFVDDLRVELAEGVKQETIDALRARADIKDNDEYNPYRDSILADLDYAEKILKDEKLDDVIVLNPNISNSYNGHLKFAMTISDYQPLGVAARAGDTLNVYVGCQGTPNVQLVFTQYHAEAKTWSKTSQTLQKGLNIIKVPELITTDKEKGGSIYIRYTGTPNANNPIKVRVSGGTKIPMLDTTLLTDDASKKAAIKTYIEELYKFNSNIESMYEEDGKIFDKKSSVLGSTEIVTKYGLLSVSSVAVEDALKSGTSDLNAQVERLFESTEAFDEMMLFFYRQKGLSENASVKTDEMPKARINIRYMQMFDGAFMYAGGYHVGIEYGSIAGLIQGKRNTDSATGYFGWGISHEIGHQINQKDTVFAEVTNNIYALLAQTSNDNDYSRLESNGIYEKIYDKVTSHTLGRAQNVFVQLGMYWQLHLAYDGNKTFNDSNSIYARINQFSRSYTNPNKLTSDELTIVYASKAAGKDLTDFFETWGLQATDKVKEEIASLGLEKETREIYYLNDAARRYKLSGKNGIQNKDILSASIENANSQDKRVTLKFSVSSDSDKILGYEILRNDVSIGFVENGTNTFTDNVGAENNRAYTYKVVAYDYLLNKTNVVTLDEVKISHDGSVKKDTFTITSNVKEAGEVVDNEDEDLDYSKLHVNNLIDGNNNTGFKGNEKIVTLNQTNDSPSTSVDNENAYVIINLNNRMSVSGIKYRALVENGELAQNTINKYKIYVSVDGTTWTPARTGSFNLKADNPEAIVYFMGQNTDSESQLWTYNNISYIKIESDGNKAGLSGAEIDVIAPPGDNVEMDETSIGVLDEDYCYLTGGCDDTKVDENGDVIGKIKKGSVIFKGNYRGNPSFNNVLIGDASNEKNVYEGYFLLFAELNSDNSVYDVADGTWIFVMTQAEYEEMLSKTNSIRAYLYRVNDAITNDDQRLTSTSKAVTNLKDYKSLPKIEIESKLENK